MLLHEHFYRESLYENEKRMPLKSTTWRPARWTFNENPCTKMRKWKTAKKTNTKKSNLPTARATTTKNTLWEVIVFLAFKASRLLKCYKNQDGSHPTWSTWLNNNYFKRNKKIQHKNKPSKQNKTKHKTTQTTSTNTKIHKTTQTNNKTKQTSLTILCDMARSGWFI